MHSSPRSIPTRERFDALVAEIKSLGFDAIDLWMGHLNWRWATDEHVAIAKRALADANLSVSSLAGWFGGDTRGICQRLPA